jgi:glycosyltransferase involved in cell wall biosynthesis
MVIAEALAHGVPVLTTTGTPWERLGASQCGWQVEPHVAALAVGLKHATALDTDALRAHGERGRDLVMSELAWPAVARKFVNLYERIA